MRVTLLGVGEAYDADEPNASALVQADGFTLLIDCGHSVVSNFWRACPGLEVVDAVYLTHHHADHVLGLIPVVDRWNSEGRRRPVTILTTAAGMSQVERMCDACDVPLGRGYTVGFRVASDTAAIGPFGMGVAPTQHSVPCHAIRLEHGGRRFGYSGDGRPTAKSRALYAGADLLLHECFLPLAATEARFHCDLPSVRSIDGPQRIGLYHVRAGCRGDMRAAVTGDERLFLPEAGDVLEV